MWSQGRKECREGEPLDDVQEKREERERKGKRAKERKRKEERNCTQEIHEPKDERRKEEKGGEINRHVGLGTGTSDTQRQPHTLDGDACLLAPLLLSLLVCVCLCYRVSVAAVAGGQETVTQERKEEAREKE